MPESLTLRHLRRRALAALVFGVALATTACDDDEPVAVPLTASEAELLGVGMWRQGFSVGVSIPIGFGSTAGAPVAAQTVEVDDEVLVSCELGGQVSNALSVFSVVDEETGAGEASITIVQSHDSCTFQEGGTTFTVSGAPNITTVWEFDGDGAGNMDFTGSIMGGVTASTGEASGQCPIDIAFDGALTAGTSVDFSIAGEVCGRAVSRSASVSVQAS